MTQGAIINYCLADNYIDSENVYGFIITPRCDLAHEAKVTHVHYLPIVDFKDWAKQDGEEYLFNNWFRKRKEKFKDKCNKYKIPFGSFSYADYEKMANKLIVNQSKRLDFLSNADIIINPQRNSQLFLEYSNKDETKKQLVKDLLEDRLAAFYLIEDWNGNNGMHKVILLRELKRVSLSSAQRISNGLDLSQIIEGKDELKKTTVPNVLCQVCAQIASPFVEHIVQRFSHNFCRIGVDDRDLEMEKESLFKQL